MPEQPADYTHLFKLIANQQAEIRRIWTLIGIAPVVTTPGALFVARIASSTKNGAAKQWQYTIVEMQKTTTGYSTWSDLPGGRTGIAFNLNEDQNGSSGTYGDGARSSDFTGTTIDLVAVPNDTRVLVYTQTLTNGTTEYWFEIPNGLQGGCS